MCFPRDVWIDGILPFLSTVDVSTVLSASCLAWSTTREEDDGWLRERVADIIERDYATLPRDHALSCPLHMDTAMDMFALMHTRSLRDPRPVPLSWIQGHARVLHAVQTPTFWHRVRQEATQQPFWKRTTVMWTILKDVFHGRGMIV